MCWQKNRKEEGGKYSKKTYLVGREEEKEREEIFGEGKNIGDINHPVMTIG